AIGARALEHKDVAEVVWIASGEIILLGPRAAQLEIECGVDIRAWHCSLNPEETSEAKYGVGLCRDVADDRGIECHGKRSRSVGINDVRSNSRLAIVANDVVLDENCVRSISLGVNINAARSRTCS